MRSHRLRLAVALFWVLAACAGKRQAIVAVPERRFRTENQATEHLRLPLDPTTRKSLEAFLSAGGDVRKAENDTVSDEGAIRRYKPLLELLQRPEALTSDDLLIKPTFKGLFHGKVVYGVVDARMPSPPPLPPLAVSDGHYWWVFYSGDGRRLDALMVFLPAVPPRQARGKY